MSDAPYSKSSTAGSAWPQGKPTDPDEWTEDELNAWINDRLLVDITFTQQWCYPERFTYPHGAAW